MATTKRLAIVGYGKMGKLIDQLAAEYDFNVSHRLTSAHAQQAIEGADVAIEFTNAESAPGNLKRIAEAGIPAVCGTTGWTDALPEVSAVVKENEGALLVSPNFSAGMAVFRRLSGLAAELLKDEQEYGGWAWEIHHDAKKDTPSGTLIQLVEGMRQRGYQRRIDTSASRAGKHPGTHEIGFDSAADTLTLRHTARSREGFARGALKSARWVMGRQGVFTFDDVLFS